MGHGLRPMTPPARITAPPPLGGLRQGEESLIYGMLLTSRTMSMPLVSMPNQSSRIGT